MSNVACGIDANPGFDGTKPLTNNEARLQMDNWIAALVAAPRMGEMNDDPEGGRYIQISDTLAQQLVVVLRGVKEVIPR